VNTSSLHGPARAGVASVGGRRLGWGEWGPADGVPVLFCTGAGMTSRFGFVGRELDGLGVRLLCVDRPGLGRSSIDLEKSCESYARDVAAVLDDRGLGPVRVLGFSQGAPFAIAVAASGRATALALVSPQDELAHPAVRPSLPAELGALVDAVATDPSGVEAAFIAQSDANGLFERVVAMSLPEDRAFYREPTFEEAWRRTLQDGFAQGAQGYARDLVLALRRWPTPPEAVPVPVHLWFGEQDTSPVHSLDLGATLVTRFARGRRTVVPGEGGALLWRRGPEILRALLSA
jgi:pimeloyl-ACP methyl ester carboxylesterase